MKKMFGKSTGSAVLETAFTLPIICSIIFFIFEAMKVNSVQSAMDAIAMELSFDFIASKNTENFQGIIKRYKPSSMGEADIRWYFDVYPDLTTMCSEAPYGGEEIFWPKIEGGKTSKNRETDDYLDLDKNGVFLERSKKSEVSLALDDYSKPELTFFNEADEFIFKTLSGKAFVLTVVCDYKFSSQMVSLLFAGGSNTKSGKRFIIWSRGVGICS
jgi:hypothetical protein